MSRRTNPYDNALAESFVATLKTECFGDCIPATKAAAKTMVFDYIETFYNTRRRHSALGYLSPHAFKKQMFPDPHTKLSGTLGSTLSWHAAGQANSRG